MTVETAVPSRKVVKDEPRIRLRQGYGATSYADSQINNVSVGRTKITKETKLFARMLRFVAFVSFCPQRLNVCFNSLAHFVATFVGLRVCSATISPGDQNDGNGKEEQFERREEPGDEISDVSNLRQQGQQRVIVVRGREEKPEQNRGRNKATDGEKHNCRVFLSTNTADAINAAGKHEQKIERLNERRRGIEK